MEGIYQVEPLELGLVAVFALVVLFLVTEIRRSWQDYWFVKGFFILILIFVVVAGVYAANNREQLQRGQLPPLLQKLKATLNR